MHQPFPQQQASWLKDILLITLVLGGLYFILLGSRPLFVPDEGRYAEIAREMVARGDYVTPFLNGVKYFEKPVLFYWLESFAIHLGGLNLWAIRSVNALLGLLGCLATYGTVRSLYDRATGLLAAFILGTSTLYFVMTHMITLDLPVTLFLALTLYCFLLGVNSATPVRAYLWAAAVFAAGAMLTKGLIGIVFPAMIIALWIALLGKWRLLLRIYLPSCLLIFFILTLPWHLLVQWRHPEFFYFYFIKQHFLRYTMLKIGHYQPVWFFIPAFIIGFFPWIVFLPQALAKTITDIWRDRHEHAKELFFFLWAILIFIFFSVSKSKLIPYILPVFPPFAILTARYLRLAIQQKYTRGTTAGLIFLFFASLLTGYICLYFPRHNVLPDPQHAILLLTSAASILVAGTILTGYFYRQLRKAIIILIATAALFLLMTFASMPAIDTRSILPIANRLNHVLMPQDEVVVYNQYYQDLPFYLQRQITILNWKNELTYGMQHQDVRDWMVNDLTFWKRWHSHKHVYALMGKDEYKKFMVKHPHERHYIIMETINNILISNQIYSASQVNTRK